MSDERPQWLPELVLLEQFSGDFDAYNANLFKIFEKDFIISRPKYDGKPVLYDKTDYKGKPECFWHITTDTDRTTGERLTSLRRCERIGWIRPMIENHQDKIVSVWENIRKYKGKKKKNVLFFLEDFDFLVILTDVKNRFYIASAYHIEFKRRKKQLIKERDAYKKAKTASETETA